MANRALRALSLSPMALSPKKASFQFVLRHQGQHDFVHIGIEGTISLIYAANSFK
jgi:hypothetical protein